MFRKDFFETWLDLGATFKLDLCKCKHFEVASKPDNPRPGTQCRTAYMFMHFAVRYRCGLHLQKSFIENRWRCITYFSFAKRNTPWSGVASTSFAEVLAVFLKEDSQTDRRRRERSKKTVVFACPKTRSPR